MTNYAPLDRGLAEILVCPRDKFPLTEEPGSVVCSKGHRYAVVEGIPILLLRETLQTHIEGSRSLEVAELGEAAQLPQFDVLPGRIDPFVQNAIGATNGSMYQHLVGKLTEYPIPKLKLPSGDGKLFLEIGCSWGRWCIAAAQIGYRAVGVDPSLKGVRAARRVARQLGVDARYIVADGRYLPFRDGVFDQVFSYSPQLDFYHQLANWLRLLMVECCFSSVRCTEAEDVTLNFGARGLTGFNLKEVRRARFEVL